MFGTGTRKTFFPGPLHPGPVSARFGRRQEPKGSWPRRLPKGQSKESGANVSNELMESSSEVASAVRTPVIPKEDLEKAILRPTRKTNAGECLKCKAGKKHSKKLHISRCEC